MCRGTRFRKRADKFCSLESIEKQDVEANEDVDNKIRKPQQEFQQ